MIDHTAPQPQDAPSTGVTRRDFLQSSLAAAGAAAVSSLPAAAATPPSSAKRPNIIMFLGEGHRNDAFSIEGHPFLKTPHMDRIAREGMRLENAFCTNALCAPARAVLLSGLYSRTNGALSNKLDHVPMPSDVPFFTDLLHQAGYDVAITGKTHLRDGAEDRYWDYYFGHNAASNNYVDPLFKEGRKGTIGPQKQYDNVWPDDLTTDRALAWMDEERGDRPFCLLVWFVSPHEVFFRPRRKFDRFNDGTIVHKPATFDDDLKGWPGKPSYFVAATNKIGSTFNHPACGSLEGIAKNYYAGIEALDDNVGRILAQLEKRNILDDTAIMLTSDHGYFLGEFRCFDKRLMHEPSIRVPMFLRYPKLIPANTVGEEMTIDVDVAPTLLELAGVPVPPHMQGKSLLPLAKGPQPQFRTEYFYEYFEFPNPENVVPHHGIRTETHKLIEYTLEPKEYELYDLSRDPNETTNLYGKPEAATVQKDLFVRMAALSAKIPTHAPGKDVG